MEYDQLLPQVQREGYAEDPAWYIPNGDLTSYPHGPVLIVCQYCNSKVVTRVHTRCGRGTCWAFFFLFLCFPIGYVIIRREGIYDAVHTCPCCRREVGTKSSC